MATTSYENKCNSLNTDRSIELKKYDEQYLQNRLDDISQAVYHMSNTIDTFREF